MTGLAKALEIFWRVWSSFTLRYHVVHLCGRGLHAVDAYPVPCQDPLSQFAPCSPIAAFGRRYPRILFLGHPGVPVAILGRCRPVTTWGSAFLP